MTQHKIRYPVVCTLIFATLMAAPAAANPTRLEAIADLIAGQDPSADAKPNTADRDIEAPDQGQVVPSVAAPLAPDGLTPAASPGPANLGELAAYVRAKVPNTPPRDILAEACTLAAKLNPNTPPSPPCKQEQ
jgi:hypothetical protein